MIRNQKAGTYQVKVYDIMDEEILWQTTVIVWNTNSSQDLKQINITSPINSSTERKSTISVIWSSLILEIRLLIFI